MSFVGQIKVSHQGVGFEEPPFWQNPWDSSWRIIFGTQQKINRKKSKCPSSAWWWGCRHELEFTHHSLVATPHFPIVANTQRKNSCDQQPCHSYFHIFHQTDSLSQRQWHHRCLTRNNNHWLISDNRSITVKVEPMFLHFQARENCEFSIQRPDKKKIVVDFWRNPTGVNSCEVGKPHGILIGEPRCFPTSTVATFPSPESLGPCK